MGGTHFLQTGYLLLNRNAPKNRDGYIASLLGQIMAKVKEPPHSWEVTKTAFDGAYNEYVGSRLAQLDEKYQLSLMLETKTLPEIREQLRLSGQLEMLQADITGLNNELRRANQEGIDLYLTHPNNTNIIDYTEGGTLSHEDAMKKYREENFGEKENKESLKSNGCGNGKKV